MRDLTKMTNIEDLRVVCKRNVPKMFYEYVDTGSWTQATYRDNVSDFNPIKFKQRILVDMDNRTLESTLLGKKVKFPAMTAPVGFMGMMWADGEIHMAKAAQKFGIPFTLSTMSICSIEDLAEAGVEPFWFQLYVMRDREFMKDLIRRAKEAKCSALMVTVDLQVLGNRHRDIKNGLSTPPKFTIPNIINLSTKIPWGMRYILGNRRWTFRNIAGHAKNVSDLSSLSSWTKEQFDPSLSWKDIAEIKMMFLNWIKSVMILFLMIFIIVGVITLNSAFVSIITQSMVNESKILEDQVTGLVAGIVSMNFIRETISLGILFILLFQTLSFLSVYVKRLITVGFYILIAPIISVGYALDVVGDKKAQSLSNWLKKFMGLVFVQPFHLLLYAIFAGTIFKILNASGGVGGPRRTVYIYARCT